MMPGSVTLLIQPRDPLIARDARPFSASDPGGRASSLDWPFPQTLAGAVRTHIGTTLGWRWTQAEQEQALAIGIHGPILAARRRPGEPWIPYFAAPRDALIFRDEGTGELQCLRLRPQTESDAGGAGTDLPADLRPLRIAADVKPAGEIAYWSMDDLVHWACYPDRESLPEHHLPPLPREIRVHVAIDHARGASMQGQLFSTDGLAFAEEPLSAPSGRVPMARKQAEPARAMLCRVADAPADWAPAPSLMTIGGERRAAAIEPTSVWPAPPPDLLGICERARRVRLQLVTPAFFGEGGWRPDWLDGRSLVGSPPGWADLQLRLISAAVGRAVAVSGWDLAQQAAKGIRSLVPAGSVYFFEVISGTISRDAIAALWLGSVCGNEQDRRDGYGLVMPGIW